jgi:hypothetical protein
MTIALHLNDAIGQREAHDAQPLIDLTLTGTRVPFEREGDANHALRPDAG